MRARVRDKGLHRLILKHLVYRAVKAARVKAGIWIPTAIQLAPPVARYFVRGLQVIAGYSLTGI